MDINDINDVNGVTGQEGSNNENDRHEDVNDVSTETMKTAEDAQNAEQSAYDASPVVDEQGSDNAPHTPETPVNENYTAERAAEGSTTNQPPVQPLGNTVYASAQPPKPRKKTKKATVTWGALIACMLVMMIAGAALGGGIMLLVNETNKTNVQQQAQATLPQGTQPAQNGENVPENTTNPSSGLTIAAGDNATAQSHDDIVEKCRNVVVSIETAVTTTSYWGEQVTGKASGSGVILTSDGYIVTNNHVISGASAIMVRLLNGEQYQATLVAYDSTTDLAVLKIDATGLQTAELGNVSEITLGEPVYAIGNATGTLENSLTRGIISGIDRSIEIDGNKMTLLQTDAAINPGNSGGGLFSAETGHLIGIVNAKSFGLEIEGLGFAIPIETVTSIATDLMDKGYVTGRPYLGLSMNEVLIPTNDSNSIYSFFGTGAKNAILVVGVQEGSPAAQAGIRVGDYILAIGDTEVGTQEEYTSALNEYKAGDKITLTIQREGVEQQIDVVSGESSGNA